MDKTALITLINEAHAAMLRDDYVSQQECANVQASLVTRLQAALADVTPEVHAALNELQSTMVYILTQRAGGLPQTRLLQLNTPMPSLALAHRLYGDASRADDIVTRNDITNSAFCRGSLEVLSR